MMNTEAILGFYLVIILISFVAAIIVAIVVYRIIKKQKEKERGYLAKINLELHNK